MPKQQSEEAAAKGVQTPSNGDQQSSDVKSEGTQPSNLTKLVRKLTHRAKPSRGKAASQTEVHDPAEAKLAGFKSRNPDLYAPAEEEPKKASFEVPEPIIRAKTLSKGQRELERLENSLILDPTPAEVLEKQEKAKETMRQSRSKRFERFLEEYL